MPRRAFEGVGMVYTSATTESYSCGVGPAPSVDLKLFSARAIRVGTSYLSAKLYVRT